MQRIDNLVDDLAANVQELATELREKIVYLRKRHELLKQLEELEPNGSDPIKNLRERLRTLKAIKKLEPNGPEPIEDLRERVQALKAVKALEPGRSEPIEDLRERVQATATNTGWRTATRGKPPALPKPQSERFAQSAAITNRLLRKQWSKGGEPAYDQDLLNLGFPKEEARTDAGTLSRGSLGAALKRPSASTYADAFSIDDPHVRAPLPLFELATSDPLFDGELPGEP